MKHLFLLLSLATMHCACTPCEIEFTESERFRSLRPTIAERLAEELAWGGLSCSLGHLGERGQEIYLSVRCTDATDAGGVNTYARVTLDVENNILAIDLPSDGSAYSRDMDKLFPVCVRKRLE